jgi:hypothetical protein
MDPILPPDLDRRPKVFGIGFHKTGTTSLGRALRALGYRVHKGFTFNLPKKRIVIPEPVTLEKIRDVAFRMIPYYSAFEDNPWPLLFREIDAAYPGSKFILTCRNSERWFRSAAQFHNGRLSPMHDFIYGEKNFRIADNETTAVRRFNTHNEEVRDYFKNRPDDLLDWDLESGPSWDRLCTFLNLAVPKRGFPHGKRQISK